MPGRVILTPHVAWASDEAQQALADQLVDNIDNFVAGRPTNWSKARTELAELPAGFPQ